MSEVTNLLLHLRTYSLPERVRLAEIAAYFAALDPPGQTAPVSIEDPSLPHGWYGGGHKAFEADLYVGAYNHFDLDAFFRFLKGLAWHPSDTVHLIVREQDDPGFWVVDVLGSATLDEPRWKPAGASAPDPEQPAPAGGPKAEVAASEDSPPERGAVPHPLIGSWEFVAGELLRPFAPT